MKFMDILCFALITLVTGVCVALMQEYRVFPGMFAGMTFKDVVAFGMFVTIIYVIRDREGHA